jgi:hypothetical protein
LQHIQKQAESTPVEGKAAGARAAKRVARGTEHVMKTEHTKERMTS